MFRGCSSIVSAYIGNFTNSISSDMEYGCANMFSGCSNLSSIETDLISWNGLVHKTEGWLRNVATSGIFTKIY